MQDLLDFTDALSVQPLLGLHRTKMHQRITEKVLLLRRHQPSVQCLGISPLALIQNRVLIRFESSVAFAFSSFSFSSKPITVLAWQIAVDRPWRIGALRVADASAASPGSARIMEREYRNLYSSACFATRIACGRSLAVRRSMKDDFSRSGMSN